MKIYYIILCIIGLINMGLIIGIIINAICKKTSEKRINERIVGGRGRRISDCPFFAGILVKKGLYRFDNAEEYEHKDQYICGCTIIGNYWAITAAHCTEPFKQEIFPLKSGYIRSGTNNWNQSKKLQKFMRDHNFKRIIQHEEYNNEKLSKDISLIKVEQPFSGKFSTRAQLAGRKYQYKEGSLCTVFGFGATHAEGTATEHLQSVDVFISNQARCKSAYDSIKDGAGLVNKWNFCAGSPKGGKDTCKYDSGGPLVQKGILIGIVSLGEQCALAKYPGVYTKVSLFYGWIAKVEQDIKEGTGARFVQNI